ncbi:MAG: hypothetical protein JXA58_08355 [Dehalococcoidia bacterium]|nr:hypothetical protein [Dehalococcoidia bacterium]
MAGIPVPGTKTRWVLTIVIVAALLAVGITRYNRLQSEQETLLASIAQTDKTITTLRATDLSTARAEVDALKTRVSNAESMEVSLARQFTAYTHSIEIHERLYRAATETDVTVTSVNCDGPKTEDVAGIQVETYSVSVSAEAAVPPSLLSFLLKISGYYESASIGSVDMSLPPPATDEGAGEKASMSFVLKVVYIPQEGA